MTHRRNDAAPWWRHPVALPGLSLLTLILGFAILAVHAGQVREEQAIRERIALTQLDTPESRHQPSPTDTWDISPRPDPRATSPHVAATTAPIPAPIPLQTEATAPATTVVASSMP